jgi:hypothetical protein
MLSRARVSAMEKKASPAQSVFQETTTGSARPTFLPIRVSSVFIRG